MPISPELPQQVRIPPKSETTSGKPENLYSADAWEQRVVIPAEDVERTQGFGLGLINDDGYEDIVAVDATDSGSALYVFINPASDTTWEKVFIANTSSEWSDRIILTDLDNDNNDHDIIVGEEGPGSMGYWLKHPDVENFGTEPFQRIDFFEGMIHSMSVYNDDILVGEHREQKRLIVYKNDGVGNLTEHVVYKGKEHHLGVQIVDIDNDGDKDIVSIAWDKPEEIHLWINQAWIPTQGVVEPGNICGPADVSPQDGIFDIVDFADFAQSYLGDCDDYPEFIYEPCGGKDSTGISSIPDGKIDIFDFNLFAQRYLEDSCALD